MADEPTSTNTPAAKPAMGVVAQTIETETGRRDTLSIDMGDGTGKEKNVSAVQREQDHGLEMDSETGLRRADVDSPEHADEVSRQADEGDGDEGEGTDGEQTEALPEFDAEKPEVVEQYGKAFKTETGGLNLTALSQDWFKNANEKNPQGDLSPGTRKYLNSLGIDDATIKATAEGQMAKVQLETQAVHAQAGGQEKYNAAIEWARKGGYSKEAAAKFNADLNAGGASRTDAVDLLMQRFSKANPTPRRASPQRTTAGASSTGGTGSGIEGYASPAEAQAAMAEARKNNDAQALEVARRRTRASKFYTGKRQA